jgi:hypothetical protein
MDNASTFLIGSILLSVSFIILAVAAIAINNLFHKYWKTVTVFSADSWTLFGNTTADNYVRNHPEYKAAEQAERVAPVLDIKEEKR